MEPIEYLNLYAIKQPKGYYIYTKDYNSEYYFRDVYINGEIPVASFVRDWFYVPTKPEKIEKEKSQPNTNFRYELIDVSMQSEKIPFSFTKEEVIKLDEDGYTVWKEEYRHLQSLYKLYSDPQPDIMVEIPFKLIELFDADHEATEKTHFAYPARQGTWSKMDEITDKNIKHRLSDEMYLPDLYLHEKPCKLLSPDLYEIIREHVKRNINSQYATVTSDYDFCFTVKKRLAIAEPIKYTVDVNSGKKRAKHKYVDRYIDSREVEIFNMTPSTKAYNNYQVLPDLEAANETELKQKLDDYLNDLLSFINEPLVDCSCCKGRGAIIPEVRKP